MRKGEMGERGVLEAATLLSPSLFPFAYFYLQPRTLFFLLLIHPLRSSLSLIVIQPRHDLAPVPR